MSKTIDQNYFQLTKWKCMPKDAVRDAVKDILSVARVKLNTPINNLKVLDVGCGAGSYCFGIEKHVRKVVGVEPYKAAYEQSLINKKRFDSKAIFVNKTIEDFRSKEKFDLVLSLTTIEHMPHAEKSFKQIFSLLKKGGITYLTAPNKWWPMENHYGLLFLSWLPLNIANFYVKLFGRGESYVDSAYSKSYFGMKEFFDKFKCKYYFRLPDKNSNYVGIANKSSFYKALKNFGIDLIRILPIFWIFSKGFIMVIKKE